MGVGLTLLGENINPKQRTMYVYRTNQKREPLGRYIIKTTEPLDLDSIREQFGPGWFYCMENGGEDPDGNPLPLATGPIYIEGREQPKKELGLIDEPLDRPSTFFREMQELHKLRMLERESRGEPSFAEQLKLIKELVQRPVTEGSDILNAFLTGADWVRPQEQNGAAERDPLTDILTRLIDAKAGGADQKLNRLTALFQRKVQILEKRIEDLQTEKRNLEIRIQNSEAVEVPGMPTDAEGFQQTIIDAVRHIAASGARDLSQALVEIAASAPNLVDEIDRLGPDTREELLQESLEDAFPDLLQPYRESLEDYLGKLRRSREPAAPIAPGEEISTGADPRPGPSKKPPGKRK